MGLSWVLNVVKIGRNLNHFLLFVVRSYRRPTNWATRSWGTFNSRLLPSFGRRPSSQKKSGCNMTALHLISVHMSHSTWTDAIEIVGLDVEVCMPGHPVRQTSYPLISACRHTWRCWCVTRNCRHEMNSYSASWTVLFLRNNHESKWKATCVVLKWARLSIADA
jgi:hypothetical protein